MTHHLATDDRRYFVHGNAMWTVYERNASKFDLRHEPNLIVASEDAIRRVRNYPTNWFELSDEGLYDLSWNT